MFIQNFIKYSSFDDAENNTTVDFVGSNNGTNRLGTVEYSIMADRLGIKASK